jgi:hypothetical protein
MPLSVDVAFSTALRTVLVEASTASWEFWFGLLENFKAAEGHCRVFRASEMGGFTLGLWVKNQRGRLHSMTPERKQRLDDIGFDWDPLSSAWEEGFSKLLQFKETEGHCQVPRNLKQDGFNLGIWFRHQRKSKYRMTSDHKQRLEDIGFDWDPQTSKWEEGFSKLVQFKEVKGHCRVPKGFKEGGFSLAGWASTQRRSRYSMSSGRRQRLEDIGFDWDPLTNKWEEGFSKLVQFKEAEGHCRVPGVFKLDGFNLGGWIGTQRRTTSSMTSDRKQRLEDIGFDWDPLTNRWEEAFRKLIQFKEAEGHCRVPKGFKAGGFSLGTWVVKQRLDKKTMSSERKQRLDDIGFVWDPNAADWEEAFLKLIQFKEAEGHCRMVESLKLEGFGLGRWVSKQRKDKDSMSSERKQRLDDIGFIWDASKDKT